MPLAWLDTAGQKKNAWSSAPKTVCSWPTSSGATPDAPLHPDCGARGDVAIEAAAKLIEENRWRRGAGKASRDVFDAWRLAARVGMVDGYVGRRLGLRDVARHHLSNLGVASGDDLALLEPGDVAPRELPSRVSDELDKAFPRQLTFGDLVFDVQYDPSRREAFLVRRKGPKGRVPPLSYLPRLQGWRVLVREASNVRELRSRRG